ncbi:MAG TPA: HEAT repeat domain-containing protein [Pyrinomonadaceae bacterium]
MAPIFLARGQGSNDVTTVSNVSSHAATNGTVIQISADGSLNRAQTFQDREGFHVVVPEAGVSDLVRSSKGVRVRRVGSSIEILVQTQPGTPVSVQNLDNRIQLMVEGKLDNAHAEGDMPVTEEVSRPQQSASSSGPNYSIPSDYPASQNYGSSYPAETTSKVPAPPTAAQTQAATPAAANPGQVRDAGEYEHKEEGNVTDAAAEGDGFLSSMFSGTSMVVILVLAIVGLLVFRKFRSKNTGSMTVVDEGDADRMDADFGKVEVVDDHPKAKPVNTGLIKQNRALPANAPTRERTPAVRSVATAPASLFGAYRIDQEVGKLVLGQAHRMDVLSSRGSEDRRAIQTSLIKTIVSPEFSDDERRRAREALEEYGFVARESATLLLAPDAFDRTSAARSLGEIGSSSALPFLLEALYDVESIVRNQAVISIGELKVPSAIGALLDMARKHPDVPASLVSKALSACSVEGLGFFDAVVPATSFLTTGEPDTNSFDFTPIDTISTVEPLLETLDDAGLAEALQQAHSESIEERSEGVKNLGQYVVQSSVNALTTIMQRDTESTVRALAVSSLAFIDHESVFPAVLIGMADESREVRAAAARALSRLSFDRSEAYVHLMQTADEETLHNVAESCIKAGIVAQNLDRLSSGDRRQAYEAFALISLLAKARMADSILDVVEHHSNQAVRVSTVNLLASTGEQYVFDHLQRLASQEGMDEEVRTALLEGMYRLEQSRPVMEVPADQFVIQEPADVIERFEEQESSPELESSFEFNVTTEADEFEP